MSPQRIRGIVAATATPVHPDYTPDTVRLVRHCQHLLDNGCDAINLLGTTGEATAFGTTQRLQVMRAVADAGLPMDRFMVGTGVCSLEETAALTRAACEMGFAGALVLPPFYYPDLSPDGLLAYIDELVQRVAHPKLALYLYHIPQNTGVPWPVEVVAQLKQRHPKALVGLKDSAGDLAYARAVVQAVEDFDVFPSAEGSLANAHGDGFAGCISATTNITAAYAQAGWSAQGTAAGLEAIGKATALRALLSRQSLIASVKAAIAVIHKDAAWERLCPPLQPLPAAQQARLIEELEQALA